MWLIAAAILALTCIAYIPAMRAGYIWDDDYYVYRNVALRSAEGLWRIWTELGATPQYYPVTHTSFWIEHQLWGSAPVGYHVTNVLLHACGAVVLWRLLKRLAVPGAMVVALLFAVHPVHVESVAWVTERKNVLSGLLYLLAFLVYWRSLGRVDEEHPPTVRWGGYALAFGLFVLALLSKTVASTLPAAILLVLWWKRGRLSWREVMPVLPMLAVGAALGSLTRYMERETVGAFGPDWQFSIAERVLIAGRAVWFYVSKLVWPAELTFIYPRWNLDPSAWWQWAFPVAVAGVIGLLFALRKRIGRGPLVAVLFFCGTLVPALGFFNTFPMLFSFVADHFQYLASIGILTLVVASAARVRAIPAPAKVAAAAVVVCTCIVLTARQGRVYRDEETLWTDTLEKNPRAWIAANNLGYLYLTRAESAGPEEANDLVQKARPLFERALQEKPDHLMARVNLGRVLDAQGEKEKARELWQSVLDAKDKANPKSWPAAAANASYLIGQQYRANGDAENAARWYQQALEVESGHVAAMTQLGTLLAGSGRLVDGVALLRRAAEMSPDTPSVWTMLGNVYFQADMAAEASDAYEQALRVRPSHVPARYGQAIAQIKLGRLAPAEETLRALLQERPDSPEVLSALGGVLARTGRLREARACLERALEVRPGFPQAMYQLERLREQQ